MDTIVLIIQQEMIIELISDVDGYLKLNFFRYINFLK